MKSVGSDSEWGGCLLGILVMISVTLGLSVVYCSRPETHPPMPAPPPVGTIAPVHLARTTEMCDRVFTKEEVQRLLERCDRDQGWVRVEWREVTCWRSRQDFGYGDYPPPLWKENAMDYPEETHHAPLPLWAVRALESGKVLRADPNP